MNASDFDRAIKLFAISNQLVEHELDRIEETYAVDLRRDHSKQVAADDSYYPQIEAAVRAEAAQMAPHYEVFYSLESTIRALISETLEAAEGTNWWSTPRIPPNIRTEAEGRRQREIDTGMTPRSEAPLDYTNFGELSEIIRSNWDVFGATLSSTKAVQRVMANLNSLRGPIAHCSPLAEDEVLRLRLSVRDWFRMME